LRVVLCPSKGSSIDPSYFDYVNSILPNSCSEIITLDETPKKQKMEMVRIIESSHEPLLLISGEAVPSRGTLDLIVNAKNLGTRALIGRPANHNESTCYVSGKKVFLSNETRDISTLVNAISGEILVLDLSIKESISEFVKMLSEHHSENKFRDVFEEITMYLSNKSLLSAVDARDFPVLTMSKKNELARCIEFLPNKVTEIKYARKSCVKEGDNLWTALAVSPWTKFIAAGLARTRITPNLITVLSLFLALLASSFFAIGERWATILGGVLVHLAFSADCIDGQLARLTGQFTKIGAWLDLISDRIKEILIVAGLSLGASQSNSRSWIIGALVIATIVTRAQINQSFEVHRPDQNPFDVRGPSNPLGYISLNYRVKNFLTLPYGNRMGLITILSLLVASEPILFSLLIWNSFALTYQLLGRLRKGGSEANKTPIDLRGDGFIASKLRTVLPTLNSEFVLLCLGLFISSAFFQQWLIFLSSVFISICFAASSLQPRSKWLEPVCSIIGEFGPVLGLMALVHSDNWWMVFICCSILAAVRLLNTTNTQLADDKDPAYGVILNQHNFFGWEVRSFGFVLLFYLEPIAGTVAAVFLFLFVVFSLVRQGCQIVNVT